MKNNEVLFFLYYNYAEPNVEEIVNITIILNSLLLLLKKKKKKKKNNNKIKINK